LRAQQTLLLDDPTGNVGETQVAFARSELQAAARVLLGEVEACHQQALRALDELSVFECLLRSIDFCLERLKLGVPCGGEPDGSIELTRVDGLRQIRADAARDRALDQARVVDT